MEMRLIMCSVLLLAVCPGCDSFSYPFTQVSGPYEMGFTPADSGIVSIVVKDDCLGGVAVLEPGVQVAGGTTLSRTWDLEDGDGEPVEDGLYFVEASLDSAVFSTILLEVSR